jgi:uridine kinase
MHTGTGLLLPQTYSPGLMRTLAEELAARQRVLGRPLLVSVAGGSCTGKSTLIAAGLAAELGTQALVISQDNFQWGLARPDLIHSPYQADDPANYGIEECATLLSRLRNGQGAEMPRYSFRERQRSGTLALSPHPVILLEGLYVADAVIYVESPLAARMMRRVLRNTFERYRAEPGRVMKSYLLGGVLKAHRDLVIRQKAAAQYLIRVPFDAAGAVHRFALSSLPEVTDAPVQFRFTLSPEAACQVLGGPDTGLEFVFRVRNLPCFRFPIEADTLHQLRTVSLQSY